MKLRLKSHSVRFRLTAEDMDNLRSAGRAECTTVLPLAGGDQLRYTFAVEARGECGSEMQASGNGFTLVLGQEDWQTLNKDENEGVYLRREWQDDAGHDQRTVFYVEKDQKADKHKHETRNHKDIPITEGGGSEE